MRLPPSEVLKSWPTPNYTNPITRGNELIIITAIFFPIAMSMVALRVWTRVQISKSFGADDVVLLISVPPTIAIAVLTVLAVHDWGWDRHVWDVKPKIISEGLKLVIAMQSLFSVTVCSYKISLLILTRRIMSTGTGYLRHVAAAGIVVVTAEAFVFVLVVIFTCNPVSDYWTISTGPQNCINERVHLLVAGIINTATDFLIFFLPIPTVLRLRIPFRTQAILTLLFGAGFIVCIAGCVRIYYTWEATSTYDRTWVSYGVWISAMIEVYVGIICAALPATKPFFSKYFPKILGSTSSSPTEMSQMVRTIGGSEQESRPANNSEPEFFIFKSQGRNFELGKMEPSSDAKQMLPRPPPSSHSANSNNVMRREGSFTVTTTITGGGSSGRSRRRQSSTPRSKFSVSQLPRSRDANMERGSGSTEELMT